MFYLYFLVEKGVSIYKTFLLKIMIKFQTFLLFSNINLYIYLYLFKYADLKWLYILTYPMKDQTHRERDEIAYYYQMLASDQKGEREEANQFFERLIDSNTVFPKAWNILTKSGSKSYRTLAATLIHSWLLKHLKELPVREKLHLKDLLMSPQGQLGNAQQANSTIRVMSQIIALIAVNLYPHSWPSFFEEILTFKERGIYCFKSFLEVLQEIPRTFDYQTSLQRRQKIVVLQTFKQQNQRSQLIQMFLNSLEVGIQEVIVKILVIVQQWVKHGFPILSNPKFIKTLLHITLTQDHHIRQHSLDIIVNSLSKTALEKRCTLQSETSINFNTTLFSSQELQSVLFVFDFLLINSEKILHQIFTVHGIDDLKSLIDIISILMIQFGFLQQNGAAQLPKIIENILGNSQNNLLFSFQTFQFLELYLNKLYTLPPQFLEQLHNNGIRAPDLSMEVLQLIISKIVIQDQQNEFLKQENEVSGKISFWTFREQSRRLIKTIFDFTVVSYPQTGLHLFDSQIKKALSQKQSTSELKYSSCIELEMFVLDTCYSTNLPPDILHYQSKKAEEIVISALKLRKENKRQINSTVENQLLVIISRFSRTIAQKSALYLECLTFCIENLQQSSTQESLLAFSGLMNEMPEEGIEQWVFPLMPTLLQRPSKELAVHEELATGIFRSILNSSDLMLKFAFLQYWKSQFSQKIESLNLQYQSSILDYHFHMCGLIEIKVILSLFEIQPQEHRPKLTSFFLETLEEGLALGVQTLNIIFQQQREADSEVSISRCVSVFRTIIDKIPSFPWNPKYEESFFPLLECTFQLFDTHNYALLLAFSPIIELTAAGLKHFREHPPESYDSFFRRSVLPVLDNYIKRYYQILCKGNLQAIDPDLIKFYFTLQEGIAIYQPLYLKVQDYLIIDFALKFLEIYEPSLQKVLLSFLKCCIQINYQPKKMQILRKIFYLLPDIDQSCHYIIVQLIILILSGETETDIRRKLKIFLSGENYLFLPEEIMMLALEFLPLFIKAKKIREVSGTVAYIVQEKREGALESLSTIQGVLRAWSNNIKK